MKSCLCLANTNTPSTDYCNFELSQFFYHFAVVAIVFVVVQQVSSDLSLFAQNIKLQGKSPSFPVGVTNEHSTPPRLDSTPLDTTHKSK